MASRRDSSFSFFLFFLSHFLFGSFLKLFEKERRRVLEEYFLFLIKIITANIFDKLYFKLRIYIYMYIFVCVFSLAEKYFVYFEKNLQFSVHVYFPSNV